MGEELDYIFRQRRQPAAVGLSAQPGLNLVKVSYDWCSNSIRLLYQDPERK
jgi:hypothetical protein